MTNGVRSRCACAKAEYVHVFLASLKRKVTQSLCVVVYPVRAVSREGLWLPSATSPNGPELCACCPVLASSFLPYSLPMTCRVKRICQMSISRCRIYDVVRQSSSDFYSRLRKAASRPPGKRHQSRSRIRRPSRHQLVDRSDLRVLLPEKVDFFIPCVHSFTSIKAHDRSACDSQLQGLVTTD